MGNHFLGRLAAGPGNSGLAAASLCREVLMQLLQNAITQAKCHRSVSTTQPRR
jgi:hypothetical protein